MAEENLEFKLTEEDKKNVRSDCIKGTLYTYGAMGVGVAGLVTAGIQKHDPTGYILTGVIAASTLFLAGLMFSMGCYYYTPPSERGGYHKAHPWMPEKVVKNMQK